MNKSALESLLATRITHVVAISICFSVSLQTSADVYEIETQTSMPHLRESLRYTDSRIHRCITSQATADYFPILDHPSFDGCNLTSGEAVSNSTLYLLICPSSSGTTGAALIQNEDNRINGVLSVKLGGKNMTFTQRIQAHRIGDCNIEP